MPDNVMEQIAGEIRSAERAVVSGARRSSRGTHCGTHTQDRSLHLRSCGGFYEQHASVCRRSSTGRASTGKRAHAIWRRQKTPICAPSGALPRQRISPAYRRPMGDFSAMGAVVSEKLVGIPLQSIIMKAALLPGYAGLGLLQNAATASGVWLRTFQRITAQSAEASGWRWAAT